MGKKHIIETSQEEAVKESEKIAALDWFSQVYLQSPILMEFYTNLKKVKGTSQPQNGQ